MTNKNITNKGQNSKSLLDSDEVLNQIQISLVHGLKPLMIAYFEKVDLLIIDMAERADSNKKQKEYFDSIKTIKVHKLNVLSSFLSSIKHTFDSFKVNNFNYFDAKITQAVKKKNAITESIDKSDIDEKLTQNSLIQRIEGLFRDDVNAFKERFSLLKAIPLETYHIPISPYVLVSSFAKSIRLLHLDLDIKLVLYNQYEGVVLSKISKIYNEIHQFLNDNSIFSELEDKSTITPSDEPKRENAPCKNKEETLVKNKEVIKEKETQKNIIVETDTLLQISTIFQKQLVLGLSEDPPAELSSIEIKNTLYRKIEELIPKESNMHISQPHKDAINLITMMFQLVSGDRNIPKTIKSLLSNLHIPYIKAAIIDSNFLINKQHPAQIILASISKASIGWTTEKDTNNQFIKKVERTIETVLNQEELDEPFFTSLLNTYQGSISKQKNEFKQEQKRVKNKLKGRNRIVSAMKTVEAIISHKLRDENVVPLINNLLLGPWKNLLVLMLVRHSNTSEEYLVKVSFIDDLIAVIHSTQYEVIIRKKIEKICRKYEEGLKLVAYNDSGLSDKVLELNQYLLDVHGFQSIKSINNDPVDATSKTQIHQINENDLNDQTYSKVSIQDLQPASAEAKTLSDSLLTGLNDLEKELIHSFTLGTWFEFHRSNKSSVKAQLSWISPKTGMFLFVNSRGLKVVDKMPKEFISGLNDESISMLKKH